MTWLAAMLLHYLKEDVFLKGHNMKKVPRSSTTGKEKRKKLKVWSMLKAQYYMTKIMKLLYTYHYQ